MQIRKCYERARQFPESVESRGLSRASIMRRCAEKAVAGLRLAISGPLKPLGPIQHYRIEGFKVGPNRPRMVPRDKDFFSMSKNNW